ncbi:5-hydroxytryptamine receptor 1-like [Aplysia californica]|uniref:5-hydroxytryptamine receptor 1-like n=1 Tax=Aplysia californica TaxID=6500 RepID=A0ABM0JZN7_APLCA|nr:5-hydroxytryptamine receptor 1-like [Aplysia californica]
MESLTTLTHEVPHPENVVWAPPAYDEQHHLFFSHGPVLIGIVGSLIITVAMVGNVLVCLAIFTEPILSHSRSNFFIVSLAVADLLLALLVMTFALVNDLYGYWLFGETVCFIWMSADVMCETASIFSICAISYDRLKQVQKPLHYEEFMTTTRALLIIACLWICSFVGSFVPIFLEWHERSVEEIKANFKGSGSDKDRVKKKAAEAQTFSPTSNQSSGAVQKLNTKPECLFDVHFTCSVIYSFICFYIPCTIMLTNYFRLFLIARKHRHRINSIKPQVNGGVQQPRSQRTSFNRKCGVRGSKAARTLTIITGTFLACWLPFFIINPIAAIDEHLIPLEYFMVTIWLGYFNSCVNPIIYGTSNSKFRAAFKRLLGCRSVRGNVRGFSPRRSIYRAFSWIQPSRLDFTPSRRCSRTVSCSFHSDTREVDKNSDGGNSVKAEPSKSEVIITEQESSYNSS